MCSSVCWIDSTWGHFEEWESVERVLFSVALGITAWSKTTTPETWTVAPSILIAYPTDVAVTSTHTISVFQPVE